MRKNNVVKRIAGLALVASFALGTTSCSLIKTDSDKDMAQVVATVDITGHSDFKGTGKFAAYAPIVKKATGTILKRDLISFFLNYGSSYVQNYGYEQTFNLLMDSLVSRKIMVQYAMAYYMAQEDSVYTEVGHDAFVEAELASQTDEDRKELLEEHSTVLTLKYFLTEFDSDGSADFEHYEKAEYTLKKIVNQTLDASEEGYIAAEKEDEDKVFGADRTKPTGVGTEKDDYYSADYEVYTGHNTAGSCGTYEKLDDSTQLTRRKAYNDFLANLSANNLLGSDEETIDFTKTNYYYDQLKEQLEQALMEKLSDDIVESEGDVLTESYLQGRYDQLVTQQQNLYASNPKAFETAIQSVSDTSFVVYTPGQNMGFVYNILIPFSATDSQRLQIARGKGVTDVSTLSLEKQKAYYSIRAEVLEGVKAKDQRASWFSNNEDKNYSYVGDDGKYYFFEDNFVETDRYEELKQYLGKYPYNGTVTKEGDEIVAVKPNALTLEQFLDVMEGYISDSVGKNNVIAPRTTLSDYVEANESYANGPIDFKQFMKYEGKVNLTDTSLDGYFNKESDLYKATSAVNEIMFAYSTDPGCFNTYFGYAMSSLTDKYVKEFAYAAQYAVNKGVGTYVVCATEYGWHVMYVTVAYGSTAGEVYAGYNDADKETEGTFSYLWYEALKEASADVSKTKLETEVLGDYKSEDSVEKFVSRYQDLLDLDK